jgi:hypothetical protein
MHEIPAATSELAGALEALVACLAVRDEPRNADAIVGLGSDSADVADQAGPPYDTNDCATRPAS